MLRPNLSHQSILTPNDFYNKDALCTRGFLHQWTRTPETFYTRNLFLHLVFIQFLFHQKTLTPETFHKQPAHSTPKAFGHQKNFYKRNLLQQRLKIFFTPDDFYARSTLHQRVFTAEGFYPDPFTPNNFCTRNRLITTGNLLVHFFYKEPLYQKCLTLTLEALYTKAFSQQKTFTPDPFCTKQLLHQKPLN